MIIKNMDDLITLTISDFAFEFQQAFSGLALSLLQGGSPMPAVSYARLMAVWRMVDPGEAERARRSIVSSPGGYELKGEYVP